MTNDPEIHLIYWNIVNIYLHHLHKTISLIVLKDMRFDQQAPCSNNLFSWNFWFSNSVERFLCIRHLSGQCIHSLNKKIRLRRYWVNRGINSGSNVIILVIKLDHQPSLYLPHRDTSQMFTSLNISAQEIYLSDAARVGTGVTRSCIIFIANIAGNTSKNNAKSRSAASISTLRPPYDPCHRLTSYQLVINVTIFSLR